MGFNRKNKGVNMSNLKPNIAAELARDVYAVQSAIELKIFMMRPEFSNTDGNKIHLKAEVGSRLINSSDSFGVCAVGGKGYENDIFIVFRGTSRANSTNDWLSNARIGVEPTRTGLPVHIGFNQIFISMLPEIKQFLAQNPGKNGTIHCIGHSLGGAVATVTADWIKSNTANHVALYTFGAPRVGLTFFAYRVTGKLGKENIYRTFHATDPVPMIPIFPFMHTPLPGYGHYIPSSENILSTDAHDIKKYVSSVKNKTWENLQARAPLYGVENAVEEWLKSKIPVNPASPVIWHWLNAALIYVLKKISGPAIGVLHGGFLLLDTFADKIAWLLLQGKDVLDKGVNLVSELVRKIMQALGMVVTLAENLTKALLKDILIKLMSRINQEARRALQKIS
jgi:triacylglycerol lipase